MSPSISPLVAMIGLVGLCVILLPLGAVITRVGERLVGRRFDCSVPERLLLSLYAAGGVLFVLASFPIPIFYESTVVGLLLLGAGSLAVLWAREAWRPVRALLAFARTVPGLLLLFGTIGMLAFEVITAGHPPLPNAFDGAAQALFVHLLLMNHVVPFTLQPYAAAGVTYPQATAVWLSLPALLWGWPVVQLPAVVPLLFLSLSIPAAYCWGERWGGFRTATGRRTGLLMAAFFGVTASWPRLFVGGSYDFTLALPLLFLVTGWLLPLVDRPPWSWRETLGVAFLVGSILSLSVSAGETLVLFLFLALLVMPRVRWNVALQLLPRIVTVAALGLVFLARPLYGTLLWRGFPGHVLSAVGSPPYHSSAPLVPTSIAYQEVIGLLDPFVPWKAKLSPFPDVSVELAVLLAGGILLIALVLLLRKPSLGAFLPPGLARWTLTYVVVTFAMTGALVLAESTNPVLTGIESVTSLSEESILLFIGYQLVALLPLLAAAKVLATRSSSDAPEIPTVRDGGPSSRRRRNSSAAPIVWVIGAVLLVGIPLTSGLAFTLADGPGFLRTQASQMGNATPGDFAALQWAGASLPSCSRVLVAPGSAALFLPEYAEVHVLFPMVPTPFNLSYNVSVSDLTSASYGPVTRSAMLDLDVTEVFVTGRTSTSYAPFQPEPLVNSSNFSLLYSESDAYIFGFSPGVAETGCGW